MNRECWYPDKCVRLCIINPSLCTGSKHFSSPFDDHHFHFHCPHTTSITLSLQCYFKTHFDWEKRKTNVLWIFSAIKIHLYLHSGNVSNGYNLVIASKEFFFLLQNSFRTNWFLPRLVVSVLGRCNWYGTLCMAAILPFFCNLYKYNCHTWAIVMCSRLE